MPNDFPHISDTDFPLLDTVNAYKYKNDFDYSQYDSVQMEITICSVPWDVGLIHVGNAQIGGLGNVVDFESEEARDAWFDSLENKFTWQTKYRAYHTDGFIEVPLPYQKCVLYNYVYIKYHNLPVEYAEGGKDKFFFFIRSCESLSPSNCKVEILRDTWQTYIYSVDIAYLMLQQGHAPMSVTSADDYLANPLANNSYLLAEDVNFGTTYVSRRADEIILNSGEMYACIVTSASLRRDWGALDEYTARTPDGQSMLGGQPSMFCYAIEPEHLNAFLENVKALIPQFMQTVKAVFFVKQEFVRTAESFEFSGLHEYFTLYIIEQETSDLQLVELNKTIFGYSDEYADIAKLYTYPYAYLEISDETGNANQVRIEETEGDISLTVTTSLAYPWLNLDGRLKGIGSGGNAVTFSNISGHSFNFSGDWFNHLQQWSIPTFAINVEASTVYEYESLYERRQKSLENETALEKAIRSAEAAKDNADASANTSYANSERSAIASKANSDASALTAKDNAIRSADTAKTNADNAADARKLNSDKSALTAWQNAYNTANTTKTNADNSADTTKTNADNSARTEKGNSDRIATAARDNAKAIALTSKQNTNANAVTAKEIANANAQAEYDNHADTRGVNTTLALNGEVFANEMTEHGCNLLDYQTSWDNAQIFIQAALQDDLMLATFAQNTVQSAIGNAIQGAQAGGMSGGGAIGAGVGAVGGLVATGVGAYFGSSSNAMLITNSLEQNEATANNNLQKTKNANACSRELNNVRNRQNKDTVDWTNRLNQDTSQRSKDTADANANRSKDTADANAQRSYDTDVANADRMYTAATLNNADTETTSLTNAQNTFDTSTTNNSNACDTAKLNADNTKTTAEENALRDNTVSKAANDATNRTAKANANDTYTTDVANNQRTFDAAIDNAEAALETSLENNERTFAAAVENAAAAKDTADAAIQADIDQAGLKAPYQFGEFSNGDTSTTRPIGLFCNLVTQTKDAIEQAGDHFLRFGYNVNRAWKFDGFNLMRHFTYWKAADMWISGNNVPDAYLDELRFFLLGGVCVWRNPDDIGRISIYENN